MNGRVKETIVKSVLVMAVVGMIIMPTRSQGSVKQVAVGFGLGLFGLPWCWGLV